MLSIFLKAGDFHGASAGVVAACSGALRNASIAAIQAVLITNTALIAAMLAFLNAPEHAATTTALAP